MKTDIHHRMTGSGYDKHEPVYKKKLCYKGLKLDSVFVSENWRRLHDRRRE